MCSSLIRAHGIPTTSVNGYSLSNNRKQKQTPTWACANGHTSTASLSHATPKYHTSLTPSPTHTTIIIPSAARKASSLSHATPKYHTSPLLPHTTIIIPSAARKASSLSQATPKYHTSPLLPHTTHNNHNTQCCQESIITKPGNT